MNELEKDIVHMLAYSAFEWWKQQFTILNSQEVSERLKIASNYLKWYDTVRSRVGFV